VIPEVVGPVLSLRPEGSAAWAFPLRCPTCGADLVRLTGESDTYCVNLDCAAQLVQRIAYFASRNAMDIEGLGELRVEQFVTAGLLADVADVYALDADSLLALEGFGEVSVQNLLGAIDDSRGRGMTRLLVGLSIRHVGPTIAQTLARHFPDLDGLTGASEPDLSAIDWVGPAIARSLRAFFASPENLGVIERLRLAGVDLRSDRFAADATPTAKLLAGRSIVVTGTLEGFGRAAAEEAITSRGGRSPGSVSARTYAVVVGAEPGTSKVERAEALGIPVLDEAQFRALLETGALP
jgi:DNA ligase (NAD+)